MNSSTIAYRTPAEAVAAGLDEALSETAADVPEASNPNHPLLQRLSKLGDEIFRAANMKDGTPVWELLAEARRGLDQLEKDTGVSISPPDCAAIWLDKTPMPAASHVPGLFEAGDRVCVSGQSKARKSFFVLQLALAAATGTSFLGLEAGAPRSVLLVNLEIKPARMHQRLRRMVAGQGNPDVEFRDLYVWNAADQMPGLALWQAIQSQADAVKAEVVIVDPLYRTFEGDESDPMMVKQIITAMTAMTATGRSLVYVHHSAKGRAGDRQAIDRASGSGIWIRDVSTLLSIVEHQQEGLLVLEVVARDYPPRPAATIQFDDDEGLFRVVPDQAPLIKTTTSAAKAKAPAPTLEQVAIIAEKPLLYSELTAAIRTRMGVSKHVAENAIRTAVESGTLLKRPAQGRRGTYYGQPGSFVPGDNTPWIPAEDTTTGPIVPDHPESPRDDTGE